MKILIASIRQLCDHLAADIVHGYGYGYGYISIQKKAQT